MSIWEITMEKISNSNHYLDDFLVFWMDYLLIYSQTKEVHLKYQQLVFEKF